MPMTILSPDQPVDPTVIEPKLEITVHVEGGCVRDVEASKGGNPVDFVLVIHDLDNDPDDVEDEDDKPS